jgi:endo-1,4-beta-xylanase
MRLGRENVICAVLFTAVLSGCAAPLKDAYKGDFLIGTALGSREARGEPKYIYPMRQNRQELEVAAREFNCVTAENLMKWQYLQPRPGFFNFDQADEFVAFAEKNRQTVVGHALVWHAMLPGWVFEDADGATVTREVLIERMRDHIHTVVGRYKGRIKYWDVVNEAVDTKEHRDEEGELIRREAFYRDSPWRQIIGDDYIELAFRFAHEADPDALLLYNDYAMTHPEKVDFVADMVRRLKAKGVPVHGVGIQAHWHLEYPSMEELDNAVRDLSKVGVKVSLTELDVGVLPLATDYRGADISKEVELQEELDPYTDEVPQEVLEKQAEKYRAIFEVLLRHRTKIERVTFWGISDEYSWMNDWPVKGRTAYPLLFDRKLKPKPAYHALKDLKDD